MSVTVNLDLIQLISKSKAISPCTISYQNTRPCILSFQNSELDYHSFEGVDLFEAFCKLRVFLEQAGWNILCNGSRFDTYPSPMSRNMSGGMKLYRLTIGKPAKRSDLVYIFDKAEPNQIGTVEEQRTYYEMWIKNIPQKVIK